MTIRLRRHLTAGLIVVVPVVVTAWVLLFLFNLLDRWAQPILRQLWPGGAVPGAGILLTLAVVYLIGLLSTNLAGKKLLEVFGRLLENLPLVKTVYTASKQLVHAVSAGGRRAFRRVVLVDFPKTGTYSLGFVTGDPVGPPNGRRLPVYVPTAINPTSGFVIFPEESEILEVEISVEEGLKLVVSGGIVQPDGALDAAFSSQRRRERETPPIAEQRPFSDPDSRPGADNAPDVGTRR